VESNNVLGRARQVGDDEAAAWNDEASPAKEPVVLLSPACTSFDQYLEFRDARPGLHQSGAGNSPDRERDDPLLMLRKP